MFRLLKLMQYGGVIPNNAPALAGPSTGNQFCPLTPVNLKSNLTDYGYLSAEPTSF